MTICADASVALAFLLDESSLKANALMYDLQDGILLVPAHWPIEVLNGLLMSLRRGRMDDETFGRQFATFHDLHAKAIVDESANWSEIAELGRRHRLTACDAAYVELCRRRGASMATLDRRMSAVVEELDLRLYFL